ncbi:hypothetical protein L226DRAFT_565806 [Lentinus tigrinus ALCF2SS1-7]|uniref:Vacuole protein n=1 Tax=Lentinus tigrinus ALCF2SS1-6 TaxID=1328759 RepID=A0A5C2SUS6_9APHY|nr:hypothetical protein L227DRAFT_491035 [Lentinus tigrinus ALCF2SS1-6]RPD80994.1 hypothetical protein L226DRAFT_565806 [Lentinus tigrinus ALCF2SS1-7]
MCKGGSWKREVVPDHKFDFVDTREFRDSGCGMRMKYLWLYVGVLISFLVYVSDIFTAVTMLTTTSWSNAIFNSCPENQSNGCVYIPFSIGRWLFFGCVIFSFLLLAYEAYKAKKIIQSRDISYAFTNVMANNYYSLRSYDHFCFFNHIAASTKRQDDFAFFVFFTFKSWKRLLFADGPRQSINALTLYAFYLSKEDDGDWYQISKYFDGDLITSALTVSTTFTVLVFALSLLMLIIAGICYIPLLCHIQGNLKEYCCYKVDKRIAEIIKRRNKQRLAKAAALAKKEAAGDFSHLKNKKGEFIAKPLPQPTLPNLSVDDDIDDTASMRTRVPPSTYTATNTTDYLNDYKSEYAADYSPMDYPPMPSYANGYHQYNGSIGTLPDQPQQIYDDDHASQVHLASAAAPFAHDEQHSQHSAYGGYESYDPYRAGSTAPDYRSGSTAPDYRSGSTAPDYRSMSTAPDYRSGSAAPDYRSMSTAPDYRSMSTAPDYRSASTAPDYRSASTAPYGQQGQPAMYHQDEYHPNPYSPGAQQSLGYGQTHDPFGYQRQSGGSDGYDYNAGHAHAM